MANIVSQIKRNRQNERARVRNKASRSSIKTALKRFDTAIQDGDVDVAADAYRHAASKLDRAAGRNVVHRNYAANRKASMAKRLQSI